MSESDASTQVTLSGLHDVLIATFQMELYPETMDLFQQQLLTLLHHSKYSGLLMDLSMTRILDLEDFDRLNEITKMAAMMGTPAVLVGLRPGVIRGLLDMGLDPAGLRCAGDIDQARELLSG